MPTEITPIGKDVHSVIHSGDVYQLLTIECVATLINQHSKHLKVQSLVNVGV